MDNIFEPLLKNIEFETCCTSLYENDVVKFLLGDSFHPGGVKLTNHLADKLHLQNNSKVLDIASGIGTSSLAIAKNFGVEIIGIDLSSENVQIANSKTEQLGLSDKVKFQIAKAERLPFPDNYFDAIISECSFCIFMDKQKVASEMFRVLKPGGYLGISDVVVEKKLPLNLDPMIYRVSCISDAQSINQYLRYFENGGFVSLQVEDHNNKLLDLHKSIKKKILLLDMAKNMKHLKLDQINFDEIDFDEINKWADFIKEFAAPGYGSYAIIVGMKPN